MSNISSDKLEKLNKKLKDNLFINGSQPTKEDAEIFEIIRHHFKLDKTLYPNIFAWLQFISLYEDNVIQSWKNINNKNSKEENEFDLIILEKVKNKNNKIPYSIILLEIKIWDSEQDLVYLVNKIQKIKKEGLYWKKEYKLVEIAFGIKKIILTLIVNDNKISIDELIDEIESWENEIQSVDILSFKEL